MKPRVSLIIPTLNAEPFVQRLMSSLGEQTLPASEIIVMDSQSDDGSAARFRDLGAQVHTVERATFHHASVRNAGARLASGDVLVFMTQDALPRHPEWLEHLTRPLADGTAAASFARQAPRQTATPLEGFARTTNYPAQSRVVGKDDIARSGVRAFFFSNSCSAVRRDVFECLGGFPGHTIMSEDMLFAAALLKTGHRIAYVAEAVVEHSHDYGAAQTFRRYFDIGVVFEQARGDLAGVSLGGEGLRYVSKLFTHLLESGHYDCLAGAAVESAAKWVGVSLGKRHRVLPLELKRRFSMHRNYWR